MGAQGSQSEMSAYASSIEYTETESLPYSDKQLFDLIADVERYPEFLPGWLSVKIKSRSDTTISAHQEIGVPLFNWEFDSTATLDAPRHIHVTAQDGPFRHLDIHWYLEAKSRQLTQVTISVQADIVPHAKSLLNTIVEKSVHSLLEHFASRAREVYGEQ